MHASGGGRGGGEQRRCSEGGAAHFQVKRAGIIFAESRQGRQTFEDGSYRYLFCTYVSRVTCHMATRLNGRDGFGTFQRGRIHVSIDIFNLNSFLFRRWETIIVFLPSRGLLWGFNIYAVYVFPNMNMHNLAP